MNEKLFDLKGKTALVTGSSRGIGRAIAFALGRAGARVYFHGSKESAALTDAVSAAQAEGIACEMRFCDMGNMAAIKELVASTADADIVVLNASSQHYGHINDFTDDEYDWMYNTNVRGAFVMMKEFGAKLCAKGWGRIIYLGSVNQAHPAQRFAIYGSSKAAGHALVLTAAKTFAPSGVTVNTIVPGVIATDRNHEALSNQEFADNLLKAIPAGRFGRAEDCAGVALLLASDAGAYITGAAIPVDGGFSL